MTSMEKYGFCLEWVTSSGIIIELSDSLTDGGDPCADQAFAKHALHEMHSFNCALLGPETGTVSTGSPNRLRSRLIAGVSACVMTLNWK